MGDKFLATFQNIFPESFRRLQPVEISPPVEHTHGSQQFRSGPIHDIDNGVVTIETGEEIVS
jgi:hypothetical protein